ncbi:MAG: DEAD/DEAH box helicase family protein [Pseudomonadota bacterium]
MDDNALRALRRRYKAHIGRPEHSEALRAGQLQVSDDILAWMGEKEEDGKLPTSDYIVRPTGSGKTVSLIDFALGINCSPKPGPPELLWDKRVLVLAPTNVLCRQFAAELGVEKYRKQGKRYAYQAIPEDKVGLYDASESNKHTRDEALGKHFVVMTYDSFKLAVEQDRMKVSDFAATLLDEVHTKPRGDVTSEFLKRELFNVDAHGNKLGEAPTLAIGATATHLYKSGHTIGDYLFDGKTPIHNTPINFAVKNKEICGYRNVIVETTYNEHANVETSQDVTPAERTAFLKQEARDEAAIRILKDGHDPKTGKPYRESKSVWYCKDIAHANRLADKINATMGTPNTNDGEPSPKAYARAVSGKTHPNEFQVVVERYGRGDKGDPKAITNADLLIHGFDDEQAELCFMTWPSQSPIEVLQMGGRVLRRDPNNPDKFGTIFNFLDPDQKNPAIFGELAGGYYAYSGEEFGPTTGRQAAGEAPEYPWPDTLKDLNVHYLTRDIEQFAARRRAAQAADKKPKNLWSVDEMAKAIGVDKNILQKYVYEPLSGLYDQRKNRQAEIDIRDARAYSDDMVSINGQRFAIGTAQFPGMGYFHTGAAANDTNFCIDEKAKDACRFALYGKLPKPQPYLYSETAAARVVGTSPAEIQQIKSEIVTAYHGRKSYQRTFDVTHTTYGGEQTVRMTLNRDMIFCLDGNAPKLFFTADGIAKLHQLAIGTSEQAATQWWQDHPDGLAHVKTPRWLNQDEARAALKINPNHDDAKVFASTWKSLQAQSRRKANSDAHDGIECGAKRTAVAPSSSSEFCVTSDSLDAIRERIWPSTEVAGGYGSAAATKAVGWGSR